MKHRIFPKTLVSAVAGATLCSSGFAQNVLEEVVVVAQKREQNLQEVPIAINAFTGRQMNASGRIREF
jgi:iron complex outermembrane receptor protein